MSSTTITITNIHCNEPSEIGHDEVYIKYTVDGGHAKRFPSSGYHSMGSGDNWDPDLPITFKQNVVVGLYDQDTLGDENLGTHTYTTTSPQPETEPYTNTNGANYTVTTE